MIAHIGEAKAFAETFVESEGLTYINGYDDPPIIAGAGTIGIEIIDEVPCVDAVVVPVGGAGKENIAAVLNDAIVQYNILTIPFWLFCGYHRLDCRCLLRC